ncbi:hypothetical protein QJQ45_006998 [Haematococcus lacustris]|nr:hypothetical protein QJQ45_006998 [Haematococcus lacustris]
MNHDPHVATKSQRCVVQDVSKAVVQGEHLPNQPGHECAMKGAPQFIRDTYKVQLGASPQLRVAAKARARGRQAVQLVTSRGAWGRAGVICAQGSGKLADKVALITGGDSGIGRAVAVHFAREGAKALAIMYKDEHQDAQDTQALCQQEGCAKVLLLPGDIGCSKFCSQAVEQVVEQCGGLDVIVNNAAEQHVQQSLLDITPEQLRRTFATNLFAMFYIVRAALPHLKSGASIVNTTSVTAYKGQPTLLDYSSTKGGIVSFTRALASQLASKGKAGRQQRARASTRGLGHDPHRLALAVDMVKSFGEATPLGRAGQPSEVATAYVLLASNTLGSYLTGKLQPAAMQAYVQPAAMQAAIRLAADAV